MKPNTSVDSWASAWPDALAFAIGLAVAWWANWNAGDLVWSLWLSSLVVGYSTIVWTVGRPVVELAYKGWREAVALGNPVSAFPLWTILIGGALLVMGFMTVHFGFFHYVHSQLLVFFFPIENGAGRPIDIDKLSMYGEIARRYWSFLPAAFLAERAAFMKKQPLSLIDRSPGAVAGGRAGKRVQAESWLGGPYRNVIRLHTLLFFFFFAHFAGLDNFAVYAVVYATYFFPWRLVRRSRAASMAVYPTGITRKRPTPHFG